MGHSSPSVLGAIFCGTFESLGTGGGGGGGVLGGYILKILKIENHAKINLHAKFQLFNLFLSEIIRYYIFYPF